MRSMWIGRQSGNRLKVLPPSPGRASKRQPGSGSTGQSTSYWTTDNPAREPAEQLHRIESLNSAFRIPYVLFPGVIFASAGFDGLRNARPIGRFRVRGELEPSMRFAARSLVRSSANRGRGRASRRPADPCEPGRVARGWRVSKLVGMASVLCALLCCGGCRRDHDAGELAKHVHDASRPPEMHRTDDTTSTMPVPRDEHSSSTAEFYRLVRADRTAEGAGIAALRYVRGLPAEEQLEIAREIVDDPDPLFNSLGITLLIELGEEYEVADHLASMVIAGGDLTTFYWSWLHSGDESLTSRMYVAISRRLLDRWDEFRAEEQRRAQVFLCQDGFGEPIREYSKEAVLERLRRVEESIANKRRERDAP